MIDPVQKLMIEATILRKFSDWLHENYYSNGNELLSVSDVCSIIEYESDQLESEAIIESRSHDE